MLDGSDDIVCIDIDGCLSSSGEPAPWAAELLDRCPPTWVEISRSGRGLHIWGRADFTGGRKLARPGGGIEVYGDRRFIATTGRPYRQAPVRLADLTEVLRTLL